MDPYQVGPCMPGFKAVEVIDPHTFRARVGVGIAAVKATFALEVRMVELDPPTRAMGKAHGLAPGSAQALQPDHSHRRTRSHRGRHQS